MQLPIQCIVRTLKLQGRTPAREYFKIHTHEQSGAAESVAIFVAKIRIPTAIISNETSFSKRVARAALAERHLRVSAAAADRRHDTTSQS